MSVSYKPVGWNRTKLVYDAFLVVAVIAYVLLFIDLAPRLSDLEQPLDDAVIRMRAFGTCAFLMLSFILSIGPLARLDPRWLPLLYNRRHFGVLTCVVALSHVGYVLGWYFSFSPTDPWVALLSANTSFRQFAGFPFELFGLAALIVLLVLAATSHDFWLAFLTPPVWKALHMAIYAAYACVIAHVALGAMMATHYSVLALLIGASLFAVVSVHLLAARKERRLDRARLPTASGWIEVGPPDLVSEGEGIVVALPGAERVAIFRSNGKLSALANACAHQNGPLGEGRIIDGCVTCPWHGFQYRLEDGCAPPPFTEKLATYRLKIEAGRVLLDPKPNPPGTFVEPVAIEGIVS